MIRRTRSCKAVLKPYVRDLAALRREVNEFSSLLSSKPSHVEREFLDLFGRCSHLAAAAGTINTSINAPDLVAVERTLFSFRCDVAVGQSTTADFTIIELENAEPDSIFKVRKGQRAYPSWSGRFEAGFSQLVDWAWRIEHERPPAVTLEPIFGTADPDIHYVLIIGRDRYLDASGRARLKWRRRNNGLANRVTTVWTYDDLLSFVSRRVDAAEDDALSLI